MKVLSAEGIALAVIAVVTMAVVGGDGNCNMDIFFIVDVSATTTGSEPEVKAYLRGVIDDLAIDIDRNKTHVAFIAYDYVIRSEACCYHEFYRGEIKDNKHFQRIVHNLTWQGGATYTGNALKRAYEILKRRDGYRYRNKLANATTSVIVVSDGRYKEYPYGEAQAEVVENYSQAILEMPNTKIYSINVIKTNKTDEQGLLNVTGHYPSRVFKGRDAIKKSRKVLKPRIGCEKQKAPDPVTVVKQAPVCLNTTECICTPRPRI